MALLNHFKQNGLFPEGVHEMTLQSMHQILVSDFTGSQTRDTIFNGFCSFLTQIKAIGLELCVFIDGSFTTGKLNPNDIDFVMQIVFDDRSTDKLKQLSCLINDSRGYCCDAYAYVMYPTNHQNYQASLERKDYWLDWFGHQRPDQNNFKAAKGIILLKQNDPSGVI